MSDSYKVVGLWSQPEASDVDAFEEHYTSTHVPLAAAVPGLRKITVVRADGGLNGAVPAFHRLAEMHFDSPDALATSMRSPEWQAMHEDAQRLISRFGVTMQALAGWEN
ncbi:EthD family reductase [Dietzia sp. B32]|uniref:EthD family reductase n=1 Tax=Dietzia sp. B32 TaxID=2915130 RepID=UPI0021AE2436|nr:EthD family reductase [Dietzia sp. B32]UVE93830.1 EthD family reductase [Dietzia sp. B32]